MTGYRRQIAGLFSAAAAESTRPAAQACAATLVRRLAAGGREADVIARYTMPFAAAMIVQTLGTGEWPQIKAWSDVAFGVVRSPAAVRDVDAVWAELYAFSAVPAWAAWRPPSPPVSPAVPVIRSHTSSAR